jgi:hypothetical protein
VFFFDYIQLLNIKVISFRDIFDFKVNNEVKMIFYDNYELLISYKMIFYDNYELLISYKILATDLVPCIEFYIKESHLM